MYFEQYYNKLTLKSYQQWANNKYKYPDKNLPPACTVSSCSTNYDIYESKYYWWFVMLDVNSPE